MVDPTPHRSSPPPTPRPDHGAGVTIALLTPAGRGALAVVGVRGTGATAMVATLFRTRGREGIDRWEIGRMGVGWWRGRDSAAVAAEEVVVVRVDEGWEVQCHGGTAAVGAILADLVSLGAESVPAGEWPGDGTPTVADEALGLIGAVTAPAGAAILCRQLAGELDREFTRIAALVAAGEITLARARGDRLRRAARVGLRLAVPWRVVIAGGVNVGKSSLVNALAGHARSLVSPRAGTTRDLIETPLTLDGWGIVLVDTAGLRDADAGEAGTTERAGIARALAAAAAADLVVTVVEAGGEVPNVDGIVVWSKADRLPGVPVPEGVIATSSHSGAGLGDLRAALVARLVPEAAEPGLLAGPVPFRPRHLDWLGRALSADATGGGAGGQ